MKIGIVSRTDMEEALELTRKIIGEFPNDKIVLNPEIGELLEIKGTPIKEMDVDALITIGGDGTVLHVQREAPEIPILGINMGGVGFLADVSPGDAMKAIDQLKNGKLSISELSKLSTEISGNRLPDALNEGVIRSTETGRALKFRVLVDNKKVEDIKGDGLIVSTPTGSTAYSLAAGGPIVHPDLDALVLTPISAHLSKTMPLVIPTSCEIKVKLFKIRRSANIFIDGRIAGKANSDKEIIFKLSENTAKFFEWGDEFFKKTREKL